MGTWSQIHKGNMQYPVMHPRPHFLSLLCSTLAIHESHIPVKTTTLFFWTSRLAAVFVAGKDYLG